MDDLEKKIIQIALDNDIAAEVCYLKDYDSSIGRVPEHWRVQWHVMIIVEELIKLQTITLCGVQTTHLAVESTYGKDAMQPKQSKRHDLQSTSPHDFHQRQSRTY